MATLNEMEKSTHSSPQIAKMTFKVFAVAVIMGVVIGHGIQALFLRGLVLPWNDVETHPGECLKRLPNEAGSLIRPSLALLYVDRVVQSRTMA